MDWYYEKLDENNNLKRAPMNDTDGSVTGHIVMNVQAWFDEHPEERKRLGWTKHISHEKTEADYNHQTQYVEVSVRPVDEYTVEDVLHIMEKSEEMLRIEELMHYLGFETDGRFIFF